MSKANLSHDLSFVKQDTTTEIGLMLARDRNGIPIYQETEDASLAYQIYSGEPGYANLPPDREIQIGQTDWRAGAGQEFYDKSQPNRYWKSIGCDLRFTGEATAGPLAASITIPTGVVRAHARFNDQDYIGVDDDLCKLGGTPYTTYTSINHFADGANITDLKVFGDYLMIARGAATARYEYYNTKDDTYSGSFGAQWNAQTFTPSTAHTITSVKLKLCRYGSVALPGTVTVSIRATSSGHPTGADLCSGTIDGNSLTNDFGGDWYEITFGAGYALTASTKYAIVVKATSGDANNQVTWREDSTSPTYSGGNFEQSPDSGVNWTSYTAYDFMFEESAETGTVYSYMTTGEVITASTLSDGYAQYFEVVNNIIWKAILPNELKSSTNPTNTGSWTTATTVGATSDDILQLMTESGQLFVRKEDMPYYLDTDGNIHKLIPELVTAPATSGTTGDVWQAKLYLPCGDQGLVEYDSGVVTWRSPAKFCSNISEYTGKIFAVTHDEEWLFLVTDNGSKVEVIAGRMGTAEVGADWVWHPIAELTLAGCQIAWVSSVGLKRLYVASTASLAVVTAYPLPTTYGDIDSDTNYKFQSGTSTTGVYFITPWFSANFRADKKAFRKLTLELENVDSTNYVTAKYNIWGQTGWTTIGNYDDVFETQYIPAAGTVNPTSTLIQFKFIWTIVDTTTSPRLLSFDCRGIWYPTIRNIINCTVLCADGLATRNGTDDGQTGAVIKTAIEEARDTATWPVTFYDRDGNTIYVKVLSAKYRATADTKDKNPEGVFDLVLMKVPLS